MSARRRSSTPPPPATASDLQLPKSVELEQRIARLEVRLQRTCDELEDARQRVASLQAQLDHLAARQGFI